MTLLSEIYDVTLKRDIRGAAKGGFIRPTVGEHFMTHMDFDKIHRNLPPTANPKTVQLDEGTNILINLLESTTDQENDTLMITNLTEPENGSLIDNNNGTVTYTPLPGWAGTDTFSYTISDGEFSDNNVVTITVNWVNRAPIANPDNVDAYSGIGKVINLLANDTDLDGDNITLVSVTEPEHGIISNINYSNGQVTYTATSNYIGSDTFDYTISDGALTAQGTATITIINPLSEVRYLGNIRPPQANPPWIEIQPNTSNPTVVGNALRWISAVHPPNTSFSLELPGLSASTGCTILVELRNTMPYHGINAEQFIAMAWSAGGVTFNLNGFCFWQKPLVSMSNDNFRKYLIQFTGTAIKVYANGSMTLLASQACGFSNTIRFGDGTGYFPGLGYVMEWKEIYAKSGVLTWESFN